jgi:hypothetical protein
VSIPRLSELIAAVYIDRYGLKPPPPARSRKRPRGGTSYYLALEEYRLDRELRHIEVDRQADELAERFDQG